LGEGEETIELSRRAFEKLNFGSTFLLRSAEEELAGAGNEQDPTTQVVFP